MNAAHIFATISYGLEFVRAVDREKAAADLAELESQTEGQDLYAVLEILGDYPNLQRVIKSTVDKGDREMRRPKFDPSGTFKREFRSFTRLLDKVESRGGMDLSSDR